MGLQRITGSWERRSKWLSLSLSKVVFGECVHVCLCMYVGMHVCTIVYECVCMYVHVYFLCDRVCMTGTLSHTSQVCVSESPC